MALFERTRSRPRRVDPRKLKGDGLWDRIQQSLSGPRNLMRLATLVLFCGGALLLLHAPYDPLRHREGDIVHENVSARVDFKYLDVAATELARTQAWNNTPNVYERMPVQTQQLRAEFEGLLTQAATRPPAPAGEDGSSGMPAAGAAAGGTREGPSAAAPAAGAARPAASAPDESAEPQTDYAALWTLNEEELARLRKAVRDTDAPAKARQGFESLAAFVDGLLILPKERYDVDGRERGRSQILISNKAGDGLAFERHDASQTLNADSNADRDTFEASVSARADEVLTGTVLGGSIRRKVVDRFVATFAANLQYSNKLTNMKKDEAAGLVPETYHEFRQGDTLARAGKAITAAEFKSLKAEHAAYQGRVTWWMRGGAFVGSVILVGLLTFILVTFTALYERRVIDRVIRAFILVVLFLIVMAIAKFFSAHLQRSMLVFPLTTAAMIVTIAYDRRFALVVMWAMILLVTLVARLDDYNTALLLVIGTSVAILQLGEIRSRSKLIRVGFITGVVYFVTVWGQEMLWWRDFSRVTWERSGLALLAGWLPGFIILGILPAIERVFNMVTSIRLLELCDANQPALRKLAIEAPGTYSHSLTLGSLVEPAAEAIGANGLLARVGAYFHDIGKVNKPQYFIENMDQVANAADHGKLKPQMSKLIITSHIKDGLDMAGQYGLPRAINGFIAEHHGTTVIEYFYQEAQRSDEQPVPDTEYRYPGPKPQSRETAILMLADGAEGAARSIREPTAPKIEDKVHEIVMKRLLDGQLDESGLTLNEVRAVEQNLCKSLMGIHHGRIPYPDRAEGGRDANGSPPAGESPAGLQRPAGMEDQPRGDA